MPEGLTWTVLAPCREGQLAGGAAPVVSKAQVLDWVSYQAERHRCDPGTIDLSRYELDGAALCRCAPEELRSHVA